MLLSEEWADLLRTLESEGIGWKELGRILREFFVDRAENDDEMEYFFDRTLKVPEDLERLIDTMTEFQKRHNVWE
jgi:hypothetical protein